MAEGPRCPEGASACPSGDAGRPYRSIGGSPWQGRCLAWEAQGPVCSADAAEGLVSTRGRLAGPGSATWMGKRGSRGSIWAHRFKDTDSGALPGFPEVKNPPASAGDARDVGSAPGLRRSPGEGHGNPLQYSCLESSMDRGA